MSQQHGDARTADRAVQPDLDLLAHLERTLYAAVVSDALDDLGIREQAMAEYLRPVGSKVTLAGWARTIICMDVYHVDGDPYGMEIEGVDSILPGEVIVVATGGSRRNAPWGELLSTAAVARGARGAVIDGLVRDVRRIQELGFPVFAAGMKPVDSKGRGQVVGYNVPVQCGGVLVRPGDLVVGDLDGIIVVPADRVDEVVRLATDKVVRENHSREELRNGAYLRTVYDKYGVL